MNTKEKGKKTERDTEREKMEKQTLKIRISNFQI